VHLVFHQTFASATKTYHKELGNTIITLICSQILGGVDGGTLNARVDVYGEGGDENGTASYHVLEPGGALRRNNHTSNHPLHSLNGVDSSLGVLNL